MRIMWGKEKGRKASSSTERALYRVGWIPLTSNRSSPQTAAHLDIHSKAKPIQVSRTETALSDSVHCLARSREMLDKSIRVTCNWTYGLNMLNYRPCWLIQLATRCSKALWGKSWIVCRPGCKAWRPDCKAAMAALGLATLVDELIIRTSIHGLHAVVHCWPSIDQHQDLMRLDEILHWSDCELTYRASKWTDLMRLHACNSPIHQNGQL